MPDFNYITNYVSRRAIWTVFGLIAIVILMEMEPVLPDRMVLNRECGGIWRRHPQSSKAKAMNVQLA